MNIKDVENRLMQRIENAKMISDPDVLKFGLEATLKDLQLAMYAPENPESSANSLGLCPKCGQRLPRTPEQIAEYHSPEHDGVGSEPSFEVKK